MKHGIEGQKLKEVCRVGKELHFKFANNNVLALHLMLNGNLYLFKEKNTQKNTIIELVFDDGSGLALTDYQAAATPTLNPEQSDAPDALSGKIDFEFLKSKLQKTRTPVKTFLLDQKKIRGIGNAYADEILYDAKISPFSVCNKIPGEKIKALAKSIKKVLHHAEQQILKTHPDIITGEVRDFLNIHNPKKKQSPTGAAIQQKEINSRKTYFTNEQEMFE